MGQKSDIVSRSAGEGESDIAVAARYGLLVFVAFAGSLVFYLSLLVTAQVIALGAGHGVESMRGISAWVTGGILFLTSLPIVRFAVAELPALARSYVVERLPSGLLFVLLALVGGFLMVV